MKIVVSPAQSSEAGTTKLFSVFWIGILAANCRSDFVTFNYKIKIYFYTKIYFMIITFNYGSTGFARVYRLPEALSKTM